MWKSIDGKREFVEIEGKWFNLSTGNYVKRIPKGMSSQLNPRVVGTPEQISRFIQMNQKIEIKVEEISQPEPVKLRKRSVIGKFVCCFFTCTKLVEIEEPEEKKGELIYEAPLLDYNSLGVFSLWGLSGKAFVLSVSDGDTIDIVVKLKAEDLTKDLVKYGEGRNEGILTREKRSLPCLGMKGSLYIRLCCRCNDYDAAEHDTIQGVLATNSLINKINQVRRYIWFEVIEGKDEKYGRTLAKFWFDEGRKESFSSFMCGLSDQKYGVLALPYNGGTKSDYMKNLQRYSPEYLSKIPRLELISLPSINNF